MCMGGGGDSTPEQAPPPAPPPPPPRVLDQAAPVTDVTNTANQQKKQANGLKKYRNDLSISGAVSNDSGGSTNGLGISM